MRYVMPMFVHLTGYVLKKIFPGKARQLIHVNLTEKKDITQITIAGSKRRTYTCGTGHVLKSRVTQMLYF